MITVENSRTEKTECAVREEIEQLLFAEVTLLNGDNTEEDLNMEISKILADDIIENMNVVADTFDVVEDDGENVPNGAYVYTSGSLTEMKFDRYSTVADAVRHAVRLIDAKIICDGQVVTYDSLDDDIAYYIDTRSNKAKLVSLNSVVEGMTNEFRRCSCCY